MPASTLPASPLLRLPDELLVMIADCFRAMDSSRASDRALESFAGVNRRLNVVVTPVLWQVRVFARSQLRC